MACGFPTPAQGYYDGPIDLTAMLVDDGPERHLVLVNAFAPRDWINGVNAEIATFDAA